MRGVPGEGTELGTPAWLAADPLIESVSRIANTSGGTVRVATDGRPVGDIARDVAAATGRAGA